jgi:lysozyme
MIYDTGLLVERLIKDEGLKLKPYLDTAVPPRETIGIGHNLTDKGITQATARFMCHEDIDEAIGCFDIYPWFKDLDQARQQVLICFMFNVGPGTFSKFKNFIRYCEAHDWEAAAQSWENSLWHTQVGDRAVTYERILRTGVWE